VKAAEFIARRLAVWGIDTCFTVTGGGAMHLNDAFGAEPGIAVYYHHHEQACSMAAEGYARIAGGPAVVNVTAGPGGVNALNGVFGAYTDSIPMVVVAGQVRRDTLTTLASVPGLRQLGDQEARMVEMVRPITKWARLVDDPGQLPALVDEAVVQATTGRPGPVWLDVPVDVQGADIPGADPDAPLPDAAPAVASAVVVAEVLDRIEAAARPVLLVGTGVRSAGVAHLVEPLAEALGVPVVTAWTHDTVASDHPHYAGRPGTIGTRAGNFVIQSSDLLLVLGSRLNIRQVSYNWGSFAAGADLVWVDIDEAELRKPYVSADLPVVADLADFVPALLAAASTRRLDTRESWLAWCQDIRARFEPRDADYPVRPGGINAYHLVGALSEAIRDDAVVVCGDATACIVPFQRLAVRGSMRLFSNSGCASMGYDLPAALGAAVAAPGRPVVCLAGDGSLMMNVQELQTLAASGADVLVLVLDNGGYLSIKQTQRNFFGREYGASPESGVTFPDFGRLAEGFGLPVVVLDPDGDWRAQLSGALAARGPRVCVARLDRVQEFEPRLRSRMVDGRITTPALDDMYPHLPDEVLSAVRASAPGR
jgi:acetolactate synthase-1/2/3 large subunit